VNGGEGEGGESTDMSSYVFLFNLYSIISCLVHAFQFVRPTVFPGGGGGGAGKV
jgi:hypothetical protein